VFACLPYLSFSRCHCCAVIALNPCVVAICINEYRTKSQTAVLQTKVIRVMTRLQGCNVLPLFAWRHTPTYPLLRSRFEWP